MSFNSDLDQFLRDDEMNGYSGNPKFQMILSELQSSETIESNPYNLFQQQHLDFNIESNRLKSLHSWINKHVSKEKLARFGFYYNFVSDYVKCNFCEVMIGKWGIGDDPLIEHYKHSPKCVLLNFKNTRNVPRNGLLLITELKELQESFGRIKFNKEVLPRHPDYKEENIRLQSFANWPKSMPITKEKLCAAGFFYLNSGDEVKCFYCGGCLRKWEVEDSPIEEHKKHFGEKCQFIQKNYAVLKSMYATTPKLKKMIKATQAQIDKLKEFMDKYPDLKKDKLRFRNKQLYAQLWEELTELLNRIKGPNKTTNAWREVWRNHKYNNKRNDTIRDMSS